MINFNKHLMSALEYVLSYVRFLQKIIKFEKNLCKKREVSVDWEPLGACELQVYQVCKGKKVWDKIQVSSSYLY